MHTYFHSSITFNVVTDKFYQQGSLIELALE